MVVGSVSNVAVHAGTFFAFTYVLPNPLKAKKEFEPPKEFIKILYQQIFVWLMLPHFPFGVLAALPMWFLQFKVGRRVSRWERRALVLKRDGWRLPLGHQLSRASDALVGTM